MGPITCTCKRRPGKWKASFKYSTIDISSLVYLEVFRKDNKAWAASPQSPLTGCLKVWSCTFVLHNIHCCTISASSNLHRQFRKDKTSQSRASSMFSLSKVVWGIPSAHQCQLCSDWQQADTWSCTSSDFFGSLILSAEEDNDQFGFHFSHISRAILEEAEEEASSGIHDTQSSSNRQLK